MRLYSKHKTGVTGIFRCFIIVIYDLLDNAHLMCYIKQEKIQNIFIERLFYG